MESLSIIVLLSLLIISCGPSQKEIENIAKAACSEIMATRKFEEARRIRILNDALEELGRDPYYSSSLFETQIALRGTSACMDILNPPPPPTAEEIEQERIAKERRKKIAEEMKIEREINFFKLNISLWHRVGGGDNMQSWNWPVPTSGVIFQPIWGRKL